MDILNVENNTHVRYAIDLSLHCSTQTNGEGKYFEVISKKLFRVDEG
jgi:hypothetical protein